MERWSLDYLADAMGDTKVSVNVTPDGRGDALLSTRGWTVSGTGDEETPDEVFVQPEERTMTMREFVDMLETPVGDDHGRRTPIAQTSRAVRIETVRQSARGVPKTGG
jgi:jumonji domain-containing protein 7